MLMLCELGFPTELEGQRATVLELVLFLQSSEPGAFSLWLQDRAFCVYCD